MRPPGLTTAATSSRNAAVTAPLEVSATSSRYSSVYVVTAVPHSSAELARGHRPEQLDERGVGHVTALARNLQAVAGFRAAHVVDHGRHQPGAAGAGRVYQRDRPPVDPCHV